ncbi:hypothetical protein Dda3937_04600 [Dickeya dadantii 3937]|uniref:Uncharacterized protein n=1 Tax=Dickeya dadantii (strain 3937) TaxID=198628 RepID=E0SE81_DICD3|nr:hypothetical protein Dda3937_04600 [Dickeya dadantii 3937]
MDSCQVQGHGKYIDDNTPLSRCFMPFSPPFKPKVITRSLRTGRCVNASLIASLVYPTVADSPLLHRDATQRISRFP